MLETEMTGWIPCLQGDRQSLMGYNLFDHKGAKPFMIQLLGWMGGHIVLCIQPNLSSNFVDGCRASPMIIVLCHLICSMLEGSFHLILHLGHSLGKVICSLYSRALHQETMSRAP